MRYMDINNITDLQVILIDLVIFGIYSSFFLYTKKLKFFLVGIFALLLGLILFILNLKGVSMEFIHNFIPNL
jgi:hypothetical protein